MQQRFVSDVSHELRTPLTTIRMAGEILHDSRHDFTPSVARSAELLQTQLDRFESLLSDLLEISRFDAGAAALDVEPVDLRDVVVRVVDASRPLADRRGSRVVIEGDREPCVATVDPRRVERILVNLVVNAIEHGEGRPVTVRLGASPMPWPSPCATTGSACARARAELVFNRFWRADPARARTSGGTGLGLAIALEDARLHGGWLQAWGRPGTGSVFRLTLPREAHVTLTASPLPLGPTSTASNVGSAYEQIRPVDVPRAPGRPSPPCARPMPDRSRQAIAAAAAALVVALAVAGCGGIPTSGPVHGGATLDGPPPVRVLAPPPQPGAAPADIVRGFLEAQPAVAEGMPLPVSTSPRPPPRPGRRLRRSSSTRTSRPCGSPRALTAPTP